MDQTGGKHRRLYPALRAITPRCVEVVGVREVVLAGVRVAVVLSKGREDEYELIWLRSHYVQT